MREMSAISASEVLGNLGRSLLLGLAVGVVLGTLGPFGTYERLPAPERYGFWIACMVAGLGLHVPAYWVARWITASRGWPVWPLVVASALVAAVPMTVMVNGLAVSLFQVTRLDSLPELYPLVLAISVPAQILSHLSVLRAEGARTEVAPDPVTAAETEPPVPQPVSVPARIEAAPSSRFAARIPARLGKELRALEMEDHYLRIHTALGSDLILMRMADAVAELEGADGLRVHRSWWVARAAVEGTSRDGKSMRLHLAGGLVVPVARDRQGEVRAAGFPVDLPPPRVADTP